MKVFVRFAVAVALLWPSPALAQLTVLHSGGFADPYREVLPTFENTTGLKVASTQASSQGQTSNTIPSRLRAGMAADVVIMTREGLTELVAEGRIDANSIVDLAQAPLGAAIRDGLPKPDISTVAAFRQALLNARSVNAISTTGIYMNDKLFPALGIAGEMSKRVNSLGIADVPKSDTDLILRPVSEIVALPGFNYLGPIPDEIQYISVFAAAIVTGSKNVEDAKRLIAFLSSAQAQQAARKFHMQPVAQGGR